MDFEVYYDFYRMRSLGPFSWSLTRRILDVLFPSCRRQQGAPNYNQMEGGGPSLAKIG